MIARRRTMIAARLRRAVPGLFAPVLAGALAACAADAGPARVLRVCADPNNMPFSNERGEGFENRIAEVIAADLGARV
ncbi:MAG TPA: hypothetical protein VK936_16090, partial [Longimicrobiales bacterium]|nr:hypothetical protein [Longimicrobiales bacterium]